MRTAKNGNGHGNGQSETATALINLTDGRSVRLGGFDSGRNGLTRSRPAAHSLPQETQFEVLADGTLIDLVRENSGDLGFVLYRNGATTFDRTFQNRGVAFVPPRVHRSFVDAVRWPKSLGTRETPTALLREIDDVLCTYVDLDKSDRKLVAYFALYTWLNDLLHVAPYLWIVGPYSSGKSTLLRLLSAICRRSIIAGDISPAALYTLSTDLRPTLLLDEFEPGADAQSRVLQRLLRNGSSMGQRVFRGSRAFNVFGPKAIASRQGAGDAALASRGLVVVSRPSVRALSVLDPNALAEIEDQLQPKLLAFRLENFRRAKPVTLASSRLTPRTLDIVRALAIPFLGDPELERELLEIIKPHDAQATTDRHDEPEWVVMTALLRKIHRRGAGSALLTVKELTSDVEYQLAEAGESYHLKPRKVGEVLRSLGFPTQRLGSLGRGLRVSRTLVRSIHVTAKNLGICRADTYIPEDSDEAFGGTFEECERNGFGGTCPDCEEVGLLLDNK